MNARADRLPKACHRTYAYGISWRARRKPWIVKFRRDKKHIYIGSFRNYYEAEIAAEDFLRNEK